MFHSLHEVCNVSDLLGTFLVVSNFSLLNSNSLYIEQLPKHADYKQADPNEKAITKNNCTKIIPLAEEVKSRIKARFQKEYDAYLKEKVIIIHKGKSDILNWTILHTGRV